MGTLQLLSGVTIVGIVGAVSDGTVLPMVSAISACALAAFLLGRLTLRGHQHAPQAAE
jgi:DHA1 family bicyclomycin/chloramphenicol resistance-like MFS transporter